MSKTETSKAPNAKHINIAHTLAIFSGFFGDIGFISISYPINLNVHRKYAAFNFVRRVGFITVRTESNKPMEKKIPKKILAFNICGHTTALICFFQG
ncbi:MAG TPA: hypothetical protein DCP92_09860 [Nitrospiraceae bacterium]|nr:hypothetical protein [Nitrospiraceae bacterium]